MIKYLFSPKTLVSDVVAGVTLGIESIPDGMANGLLAAVNPIHGVYAYMVGAFTGALFTSSVYMSVQGTSAMALIVASVPLIRSGGDQAVDALLALALLTGLFMIILGLLKLGKLLRWVPKSVMTGFINAVALLIILAFFLVRSFFDPRWQRNRIFFNIVVPEGASAFAEINETLLKEVQTADLRRLDSTAESLQATYLIQVPDDQALAALMDKLRTKMPTCEFSFVEQDNTLGG